LFVRANCGWNLNRVLALRGGCALISLRPCH
jgi:hypothetical protein